MLLSQREFAVLVAVVQRVVPDTTKVEQVELAHKIDAVLAGANQHLGKDFKLLLRLFDFGPLVAGHKLRRFTQLTDAEQDRYLAQWERSRLAFKRMGFQVLKRSVVAIFYGSRVSWPGIGLRGAMVTARLPA